MKVTRADITAIRRGVLKHTAPGRAPTVEVGIRAGTIDSTQWDEDTDLEDVVAIIEIVGQRRTPGMVLDLYIVDAAYDRLNLDARWTEEKGWDVFDPFA